MSEILLENRGPSVALITINRPAKRNALNFEAWRDLGLAFQRLNADPAVRAIVITGAGGAFCAGDDIAAFAAVRDRPAERALYWDTIMACYASVSASKVPVVAAVSGVCVGGGCTVALRADFRIADRTARFGVPPAKLGLVYPPDSTQLLIATAGPTVAKHMLYSGELIGVAEAKACGLVSRIAENDVVAEALAYVEPMTRNAPLSIEAAKLACNASMAGRAMEFAPQVAELSRIADASEDSLEGSRAFAQKRPARFSGR